MNPEELFTIRWQFVASHARVNVGPL
jgi:hypothetical protein